MNKILEVVPEHLRELVKVMLYMDRVIWFFLGVAFVCVILAVGGWVLRMGWS